MTMRKLLRNTMALTVVCALAQTTLAEDEKETKAPEKFQVKFETSAGNFTIDVTRSWSPNGVDHFHKAVKEGFYNGCAFFRVVPDFVVQFGINGDPEVQQKWRDNTINDDPVVKSNVRGYVTFAKTGRPNSRTTQLFINYGNNARLDDMGFSPFGVVAGDGMKVVEKIYSGYGQRPNQRFIQTEGNKYLKENFPKLDFIKKATIVGDEDKEEKEE